MDNAVNKTFDNVIRRDLDYAIYLMNMLPKRAREWLYYYAPSDFDIVSILDVYKTYGEEVVLRVLVMNSMLSAITNYSRGDHDIIPYETLRAIIGKETLKMTPAYMHKSLYDETVKQYHRDRAIGR